MSGKRQHFMPKFLQEGFASHFNRDEIFTWVYRKDKPPFNVNITNVGVEKFFYTEGTDTVADDLITDAEGPYSDLIQRSRTVIPGVISDPLIPSLISHLETRTKHFRENFLRAGNYLYSRSFDLFENGLLLDILERRILKDPSNFSNFISKKLAKQGLPLEFLNPMFIQSLLLNRSFRTDITLLLKKLAAELRPSIPKRMEEAVKFGHINALKKGISTTPRTQRYENLIYTIMEIPESNLILGDSMVLFKIERDKTYKAFLEKNDILEAVYLPLSPNRILVGSSNNHSLIPPRLSQALARCSIEYFIAHGNTNANKLLQEQIGDEALLITREDIERIIAESIMKELDSVSG